MEYVVLGVQSWNIRDEKTFRELDGVSVHYIDPSSNVDQEDKQGMFPSKVTAKKSMFDSFTTLPGIYDFEWEIVPSSPGKAHKVALKSAKYKKPFNLSASSVDHTTSSSSETENNYKSAQNEAARKAVAGAAGLNKPAVK